MSSHNNRKRDAIYGAPASYKSYQELPAVLVAADNIPENHGVHTSAEGEKTYKPFTPGVHTCEVQFEPQPERTSVIFLEDGNGFDGSPLYSIGDLEGSQVVNVRNFESHDKLTEYIFSLRRLRSYASLEEENDNDSNQSPDNSYILHGVLHDDESETYFYSPNNNPIPNNLPEVPQHPSGEGASKTKVVGIGNVFRRLGQNFNSAYKGKQPSAQKDVPEDEPAFVQPRPGPTKRTRFLHQAADDRDLWPDEMRWTGRDGGEDGRCYYIDKYGVRWQSEEGCTHGTVTEM